MSGLPASFRSSASVFVASVTSSTALSRLFSERLPPWSDVAADDTDVFQVDTAEHTEFAQSLAPDVSSSLLPQPAASSAAAQNREQEQLRAHLDARLTASTTRSIVHLG